MKKIGFNFYLRSISPALHAAIKAITLKPIFSYENKLYRIDRRCDYFIYKTKIPSIQLPK